MVLLVAAIATEPIDQDKCCRLDSCLAWSSCWPAKLVMIVLGAGGLRLVLVAVFITAWLTHQVDLLQPLYAG